MEVVARHLQQEAARRTSGDQDFFGRTAFNRYYYATFLEVRAILSTFNTDWAYLTHASVPEILRGSVQKELVKGRQKAMKASDPETILLCTKAIAAISELADLLEKAKATRVTADYSPEIPIDFSNTHDFVLNNVNVKRASEWPSSARLYLKTISLAWKQIYE